MSYRPQAPNCYDVIAKLARQYPREFDDCHRPERGERAWTFVRLAAWVLHTKVDVRFGLNGKRGNVDDLSMDAVSFVNPSAPAGGVEVYDIVGGAGGDRPSPAWIDQTIPTVNAGTIGVFVQPRPVSAGPLEPPAPPDPPATEPNPDEPPAPCETCDVVRAQLAALHEQQALIIQHQAGLATKTDVETLYRLIADHVIAEHLDDIKRRQDRNHAAITAKADDVCRLSDFRIRGVS